MTFPSEVTERKRLCLTHGLVLTITDRGALVCPKGPHTVTKWAVSNPLTGKVEAQADADELRVEEPTLAERFHRRGRGRPPKTPAMTARTEPFKLTPSDRAALRVPGQILSADRPAPKTPGRILSQRFTSGTETLNLKLMWCAAWAKTYRVTVAHLDGKTRRTGVLRHESTESEARLAMADEIAEALRVGWVEAAGRSDGSLTSIPVPKARKGRT